MHTCRRPATPSLTSSGSSRTAYQRTVHVCLRKVQEPTTPVTDQALSAWRRLLRRRTDISAVVGLAAALATLVAYILAFRAHGLWGFFDSLGRVVLFLSLGAISGGACWWASTRTERVYQGLAIAGVAVSVITYLLMLIPALVVLFVLAARFVIENLGSTRGAPYRRSRRRRR